MEIQQATAETAIASSVHQRTEIMRRPPQASAKLRGGRLVLARAVWLLVTAFSGGLFIVSIPASYSQQSSLNLVYLHEKLEDMHADLQQIGLTPSGYATYNVTIEVIFAVVCIAVGAVIFIRKSNDVMALLMSLFLVTLAASIPKTVDLNAELYPDWAWTSRILSLLSFGFFLLAFYTFPDGRFVPRWTRWIAIGCAAILAGWFLFPGTVFDGNTWPLLISLPFLAAFLGSPGVVQVYRYRQCSDSMQRHQTKWVVFGSAIALGGFIIVLLISPAFTEHELTTDLIVGTLQYLFLLFIPIAIGIAILRNRLFDIDVIINRALVYVPLTGILTGLYASSIALFQRVFIAVTGEKSDAAIVLTTLVLASTFTPIKNGLQTFADRRFKEPPDPTRKLKAFNEQVQTFIQMNDARRLAGRLLDEAVTAFQAKSGAVYLMSDGRLQLAHTHKEWNEQDAMMSVPLEFEGQQLGLLQLGPRISGQEYAERDKDMLRSDSSSVANAIWLAERGRLYTASGERVRGVTADIGRRTTPS